MLIYDNFQFTGSSEEWRVPKGVTKAFFECWGAAGGMPSGVAFAGKKGGATRGGKGPNNDAFTNSPFRDNQLGKSYANNAGYASGIKTVKEGEVYHVNVGGNGGPGQSTIRWRKNGSYVVTLRGGTGGFNGGGDGGKGAHTYQNLFNHTSTKVAFSSASMPSAANVGQKWRDTSGTDTVYRCKKRYTGGSGTLGANWKKVTVDHKHIVGPSGGGGGGATDIRKAANNLSDRILVAGGGGGAGGNFTVTGPDAWALVRCPAEPSPPFGSDDESTGARGINKTWATRISFLSGGWGRGGMGGAPGPGVVEKPTLDGGTATIAGSGGPATNRHQEGKIPGFAKGSDGKGGDADKGGARGVGGPNGTSGSSGTGGRGADASGGTDDFCAGGGGGGGGYFGGGGGGQGFKTTGIKGLSTHGGGGGGGSNYAAPEMSAFFFAGGVRPPEADGASGTGANGKGGFARITYRLPPKVRWNVAPLAAPASALFTVEFTYSPARVNGSKIAFYVVGSATDQNATVPTTTTTVAVDDPDETRFSHEFTAPANGATDAYFVKVVDEDGDSSDWIKVTTRGVTAVAHPGITPTSPATNTIKTTWPSGSLNYVAYRIAYEGTDLRTGRVREFASGWRPGGSRVNLFPQPGFVLVGGWDTDSGSIVSSTTAPVGVSGFAGRVTWIAQDDELAVLQYTDIPLDYFILDMPYRLHFDIASTVANDPKPFLIQIEDGEGILTSYEFSLSDTAANTLKGVDMTFVPRSQGITIRLYPSDSAGVYGNTIASQITQLANGLIEPAYESLVVGREDFENGIANWASVNGATLADSETSATSGTHSLQFTVVTGGVANGANTVTDFPVVAGQAYTATAQVSADTASRSMRVSMQFRDAANAAVGGIINGTLVAAPLDDYVLVTVDGVAPATATQVEIRVSTSTAVVAGEVYRADDINVYTNVFLPYFDGTNLNGNTGTVSWSGTTDSSVSVLAGTDIVEGSFTYDGPILKDGVVTHELHTTDTLRFGHSPLKDVENFTATPSTPTLPAVTLTIDNGLGLMRLSINANDGADPDKTVSFDIFRNGTRIVKGLVPHKTTRIATYDDTPRSNEAVTYVVRAFDVNGGFIDQTDGTVVTVN